MKLINNNVIIINHIKTKKYNNKINTVIPSAILLPVK